MPARKAPHSQTVYQLKLVLEDVKPPIWRRVQVRGNITLAHLHWVFQVTMGWTNSHLHMFTVDGVEYGIPFPELSTEDDLEPEEDTCYTLGDVLRGGHSRFSYRYDFGDGWDHRVEVEKCLKPEQGWHYPVCLAGKRACPPEDCGGTSGYECCLQTLRNPDDEDHGSMLQWVGGAFDAEAFELECLLLLPSKTLFL